MKPENLLQPIYFARPSSQVAQDIIGKTLILPKGERFTIVETGAFEGLTESKRPALADFTKLPGQIYAHFACGTYSLAINTDKQTIPSVITIRGIAPVDNLETMLGAKKIAEKLEIDKSMNDMIVNHSTPFFITNDNTNVNYRIVANKPKTAAENVVSFYYLKRI